MMNGVKGREPPALNVWAVGFPGQLRNGIYMWAFQAAFVSGIVGASTR